MADIPRGGEIVVTVCSTWLPGYLVTWLPGYLVTWLPGYLVTWLPGYLVTKFAKYVADIPRGGEIVVTVCSTIY